MGSGAQVRVAGPSRAVLAIATGALVTLTSAATAFVVVSGTGSVTGSAPSLAPLPPVAAPPAGPPVVELPPGALGISVPAPPAAGVFAPVGGAGGSDVVLLAAPPAGVPDPGVLLPFLPAPEDAPDAPADVPEVADGASAGDAERPTAERPRGQGPLRHGLDGTRADLDTAVDTAVDTAIDADADGLDDVEESLRTARAAARLAAAGGGADGGGAADRAHPARPEAAERAGAHPAVSASARARADAKPAHDANGTARKAHAGKKPVTGKKPHSVRQDKRQDKKAHPAKKRAVRDARSAGRGA